MLIDKIKELDDKLYEAFGELHENKSFLLGHENDVAECLIELYKLDYAIIRGTLFEEDYLKNMYERQKKIMTPKTWWGFFRKKRNAAEYYIEEEANLRADKFFENKEKVLQELEKIIKAADEEKDPVKAFEEPTNGAVPREQDKPKEVPKAKDSPAQGKDKPKQSGTPNATTSIPLIAEK